MGDWMQISLPSKGKAYKDVDVSAIRVKTLTGEQEELIAEMTSENFKKKILTVLESVVQGIDPRKLTSGDARYIMLWLGSNSYTNLYPMNVKCPNCLHEAQFDVDLNKLEYKELPDDFKCPDQLQLSTGPVEIRLQTIQDEIGAFDFSKQHNAYLYSYARTISDGSKDVLERLAMLKKAPPKDIREIRKWHTKFEHGPVMETQFTCPDCDNEGTVIVPFRLDRFLSTKLS